MEHTEAEFQLPSWDLTSIFPSLDSIGFRSNVAQLETLISDLSVQIDAPNLTASEIADALTQYNTALELAEVVEGFAVCSFLENTAVTQAREWASRTRQLRTDLQHIEQRLMPFAAEIDTLPARQNVRQDHRFWLKRARSLIRHRLSADEEELAAMLNETGGSAWELLRHQIVGAVMIHDENTGADLPLITVQQRNRDSDRGTREHAYHLEMDAWRPVAPTVANALNSIKGEVLVMNQRRGWESPLDQSLSENRIDRNVFDAMTSAAEDGLPHIQRYLNMKAAALGLDRLGWYDLYAPVGPDGTRWSFDTACDVILEQFGRYSPDARHLVEIAVNENWIDAEPRLHKQGGGMCVTVGAGRSRILTNYQPSYDGVRMLAHELGHAYHARVLHKTGRSAIQRWMTPWTLSETAAIFFETIVRDAASTHSLPVNRLAVTEPSLQLLCRRVADILCAVRFEEQVFRRRLSGPLAVEELTELMSDIQCEVYGQALNPNATHPYMWIALPHYYSTESSFNNYPYMFATLLSLGLSARFHADPTGFPEAFDDMLSRTGMSDAASLCRPLGIDLRSLEFWQSGMDVIRREIDWFADSVSETGQTGR